MNNVNRMMYEYVIPFIVITILLIPMWFLLGSAIDKEIVLQDTIVNQYKGVK
jgi:hypothetical protein